MFVCFFTVQSEWCAQIAFVTVLFTVPVFLSSFSRIVPSGGKILVELTTPSAHRIRWLQKSTALLWDEKRRGKLLGFAHVHSVAAVGSTMFVRGEGASFEVFVRTRDDMYMV